MMNPIIQIEGLNASYEYKTVLSQVNLSVYERDFLGIIGPNGGGKTTLIKCILGLHPLDKGNISFYENGNIVPEINMGYLPRWGVLLLDLLHIQFQCYPQKSPNTSYLV